MIYKFLNQHVTLNTTPTNVDSAVLVRIAHEGTGSTAHTITLRYSNTVIIGSFRILAQSEIIIEKGSDDTLSVDSGSDVTANRIAYKH